MDIEYYLEIGDKSVHIFNLPFSHKTEEPAVFDFEIRFRQKRELKAEDAIRDFYGNHRGRYDRGSTPIELLKLLLANGCNLKSRRPGYEFVLSKDYFPIRFEARSGKNVIRLGNFYRTSVSTADEEFPRFCAWLDHQCGFKGMSRMTTNQFISANFSIFGIETDSEAVLVLAENGIIASAKANILIFLTDPSNQS